VRLRLIMDDPALNLNAFAQLTGVIHKEFSREERISQTMVRF
jgi:hypothetical protein